MESMFSIFTELNYKSITEINLEKYLDTWKLNNTLINIMWIKEEKIETILS